jgi:probable F420-dependent oxidoreductase
MAYPIRLADHEGIARLAKHAEAVGFDSVLVNDHMSTMPYVREQFASPPRFYEPMVMLTYLAGVTSRVRLQTGVVVLPMREPVLLAKQVSVIDRICGGRVTLGVGVGAYRAEFASVYPARAKIPRGELVAEGIEALGLLFSQRRATYRGKHFQFEDVELYPKPVQDPFPIYSCGNADGTIRRAASAGAGWMPAGMPLPKLADGVARLRAYAQEAGRGEARIEVAPQLVLCLGRDPDAATANFLSSQAHEHLVSLSASTLRGFDPAGFAAQNLIGSPEQVVERILTLQAVGTTELAGLIVVADSESEMADQMSMFAEEVIPAFAEEGAHQ